MADKPFSFEILQNDSVILSRYDNHIIRNLSSMKGQYYDQQAYLEQLNREDVCLYEVYEIKRPEESGELLHGISIVHPGKIGTEYFMTKGHFHHVVNSAEIYYCLRGKGFMVMETPDGDWAVETLSPNNVLYVPPFWAHRSVNTSQFEDLVTFFVYPGNAGHDYGAIERQGFRKLILEIQGKPQVMDNPGWLSPMER